MKISYRILIFLIFSIISLNLVSQTQDSIYEPTEKTINKTIVVLIDSLTFSLTDSYIQQHINFIIEEGYNVILHQISKKNPTDIREYLKMRYNNYLPKLNGAIFIGDFPHPFSLVNYPDIGIVPVLSMEYYQDLDGNYTETEYPNIEFAYENHSGAVKSEIWCSVIPNIGEIGSDEAIQKIKNYFDKNFAFRQKQKKEVKIGFAEPIIGFKYMDTWQAQIDVYIKQNNYSLRTGNLTITKDNIQSDNPAFPDAKFTYETELFSNNFDFAQVGGHGNYYLFTHTDPSITIDIPWAESNTIKPLYFMDNSCNTGQFYLQKIGCLATAFLFNANNNAIIYTAATQLSFGGYGNSEGIWDNVLINKLANGLSFGEALLYNFQQEPLPSYLEIREREAYTAPRILFGDGTLKLQEFMDYNGNDFPYILKQNELTLEYNTAKVLSMNDLYIRDNDNTIDELSISISEGSHYSCNGNEIVPEDNYVGFLDIPIQLNDGVENGQEFNLIAYVESAESDVICEIADIQTTIEKTRVEIEEQIKKDLPGRFYFFQMEITTNIYNTYNEVYLKIIARGTEVGDIVRTQRIIAKKAGYTSIDDQLQKVVENLVIFPNPFHTVLHCNFSSEKSKQILIQVYNISGEKITELDRLCKTGENRFDLDFSNISEGIYIFKIIDSENNIISKKIIKK